MRKLGEAQRRAMLAGAWLLLLGSVVMTVVAVLVVRGAAAGPDLERAGDSDGQVELPSRGLFAGETVLYGAGQAATADPRCELVDESGEQLNPALVSELAVAGADPVVEDDVTWEPLLSVRTYPSGARLACAGVAASGDSALALSASTFGSATRPFVVVAAAGGGGRQPGPRSRRGGRAASTTRLLRSRLALTGSVRRYSTRVGRRLGSSRFSISSSPDAPSMTKSPIRPSHSRFVD